MRYSQVFPKSKREAPKDAVAVNHKLLVRAGYIDQLMTGSWTLLPLGWRVVTKINNIIREELNKIGCQEMLMPLMHPKDIWNETGRWDSASEVMYKLKDSREKDFVLSFTHEEIVMDLLRKHVNSYKDLPIAIYHFSTKFRNEARPQGGILRGREFLMKDLYSAHATNEDMKQFYEKVSEAYIKVFERIGFEVYTTEAAGGVFTENKTREFQVIADAGEDTIYVCEVCKNAYNIEILNPKLQTNSKYECPKCKNEMEAKRSIEVGNIFPFGDKKYAEMMKVGFTDKDGTKKLVHFASYGIGVTRVMGTAVEVFNDDKGIMWPASIAPFQIHLVDLKKSQESVLSAQEIYDKLTKIGIEVLWDDTDRGAGEKFADADLLGMPYKLVVSERTLRQAQGKMEMVEFKKRTEKESELLSLDEVINRLK
jgi:prolyl-tRNA synthetase